MLAFLAEPVMIRAEAGDEENNGNDHEKEDP